jgi:hypothetical protein
LACAISKNCHVPTSWRLPFAAPAALLWRSDASGRSSSQTRS